MNLVPLLYVGFRIIPFILVCFFVLSSIIKSDVRGIIFLGLILINCAVVIMMSNLVGIWLAPTTNPELKAMCNALSIGTNGERLSFIPLNINIVSFTFAYLVYLIGKNTQVNTNVHTIIFFTILLLAMIVWEYTNGCSSGFGIILAIIIGGGLGVGFCEMFNTLSTKYRIKGLHFFSNLTNDTDVCKLTNEDVFECT